MPKWIYLPFNFSGVNTTYFQGDNTAGAEDNEVWVPDLQPYNANEGIVATLEPALVNADSRRRGHGRGSPRRSTC